MNTVFVYKTLFNFKILAYLAVFISLFLFAEFTYGAENKEQKRVLILFPAQSDLPAYPLVEKGIKASLSNGAEFHIEYFIEFMDYYRNADETYGQLLRDLYLHKFSKHKIDLVVAYSAPSLSLVIQHINILFPQTPVVFSGITREQIKKLELSPSITGVLLDIDYRGLLETALEIHPRTRHVVIVNGASKTDMFIEKEFRKALTPYAKQFDFIYLTRLPMDRILGRVQNLPEHSVILYYVLTRDGDGKGFPPWKAASMLSTAANAPVYGCLGSYFGNGIVGGRMTSMEMTGIKAGEMALRILRGENPSDVPMTSQGTIIDLFDWRQFKRFKIREDRLPPGSIVRHKIYSFWDLYRGLIFGTLMFILLQCWLISFLHKQRNQRRKAQEDLAERLRFEEKLAELSARFVNLPPDQVHTEIKSVLESIGILFKVDRIGLFEISQEKQKLLLVHSHEKVAILSPPAEIQFRQVPWIIKKITNNELVVFSDIEDMPAEAGKDKYFGQSQGTVSLLVIPLSTGVITIGMLALAMVTHRKSWPQELIRRCRLVAEIFVNAIVRKQHEESLMQAENKYRTIADFTYDWEYWESTDNSIEYISPSCERITGFAPKEFIENPSLFGEIVVPEDRQIWDRHFTDFRKKSMPCDMQFRIQRRDGEIRWIEHNCQPAIDAQGHLQGFRASNRDITTRKRVEEKIRQSEKDLRRLATQLISAHEEERRSLARDLHDDLSQRLAALAILAGSIEQQAADKHVLDAEACCILKDRIIDISNDVHSLSRQLHPSILDDLGLKRAVESLCARFSNREGIEVALAADNIPVALSNDVSLSIYRIIQEGLNNVAKHACAHRVEVAFQRIDGKLSLAIQDDGTGFDAAEVRQKPGLGLSSMRERVRIIHGVLNITSEPEKGTTIRVQVPLEKAGSMESTETDLE